MAVRRYARAGSLAFETLRAHRFGRHDTAWALDAYANLWRGAYANLRYQRGSAARLFPGNAGRVEVYQAFGDGWEASVSDDVLGFATRVNIYGATLARYTGDFYLQWRHQRIVARGAGGGGERLLGRWYYLGDADSYVEASVSGGRSDDPLTLVGGQSHTGGGSAAWVRYWTPRWGTRLADMFTRATGAGSERGLSFSLYRRW
jgi:YaiO family outer membrane protein